MAHSQLVDGWTEPAMTATFRPLFIGLATASLAVTPIGAMVYADDQLVIQDTAPAWLETLIPSAAEADLLASDDHFEFVSGGVLISEPPPPIPPGPHPVLDASPSESAPADGPSSSLTADEALRLHSNPGADQVIYLDFDGHTIEGTAWNNRRAATIEVGEYSREEVGQEVDGFSDWEIDGIVEIWQRVAEDFAPWPVDVTTEFPGDEALYSFNLTADPRYGSHVVITQDSSWYGSSGGVAYVGTIGIDYYSPAFVFSNNLPDYAWVNNSLVKYGGSPKLVAEAASHEVGHNLGLSHDGVVDSDPNDSVDDSSGYYGGHSNADWAPIMGVGYYKPVTQWSKGEYPFASQKQDDLAIIDSFLPGRLTGSAPPAQSLGGGDSVTLDMLHDGGDIATYTVDVTEGPAAITVEKTDENGNLLADLVVTNNNTGAVVTASPDDPADWSHSITGLAAGSYTVQVRSIGWDDPAVEGDEFTAYASVGEFRMTIDVPGSSTATTSTTTTTVLGSTTSTPGTTTTVPGSTTTVVGSPTTTTTVVGSPNTTTTTTTTTPPVTPTTLDPGDDDPIEANRLTSFAPVRLLDTRAPGAPNGRLGAGENIRVPIAGVLGIDADARAAVVNVVAVRPDTNGFLSVTPCTDVQDGDRTSSLNFVASGNIANSTIASLSSNGDICVYSSAETDLVIDITGAIGPSGDAGLTDTTVRRIADSRESVGIESRLTSGDTAVITLADSVDPTTTAIAVNVTAVRPSSTGYLTIDNCSGGTTAALNFSLGETRGNNGVFALSQKQTMCVTSSTSADVIIDLTGEFGSDGYTYVPADPVRLLDTRTTGTIGAGSSTSFTVPQPPIGEIPVAASVNLASARHPRAGFVTSWDCGALAVSSALNPISGQVTANGALVPLNPTRRSCLFHEAGGELVVDLNGWWI